MITKKKSFSPNKMKQQGQNRKCIQWSWKQQKDCPCTPASTQKDSPCTPASTKSDQTNSSKSQLWDKTSSENTMKKGANLEEAPFFAGWVKLPQLVILRLSNTKQALEINYWYWLHMINVVGKCRRVLLGQRISCRYIGNGLFCQLLHTGHNQWLSEVNYFRRCHRRLRKEQFDYRESMRQQLPQNYFLIMIMKKQRAWRICIPFYPRENNKF